MNRCVWEVLQPASMVEIEMRDEDVPHVLGIEAQQPNLVHRGFLRSELRLIEKVEKCRQLRPMPDVLAPEPGVHQHQPRSGLDQQAMTHDPPLQQPMTATIEQAPAVRTTGTAIKMMDAHSQ